MMGQEAVDGQYSAAICPMRVPGEPLSTMHLHPPSPVRLTSRVCFLAIIIALVPQRSVAQSGLGTYYQWGYGWHTFASYGGGGGDASDTPTGSFARYAWPGVSMLGSGAGNPMFGALAASAQASANAAQSDIWFDANARFATQVTFHDVLTVQTAGQLDFSLLMGGSLSVNPGPGDPMCASDYRLNFFFGQCARIGAKMTVSGPVNSNFEVARTTVAGSPSNAASSGLLTVNAGDVLQIDGYFMAGASTCEVYTGFPCTDPTGAGSTASSAGWANYFIDEYGGATYTTDSGTDYATTLTATPEPASIMLLATGLVALGLVANRRRAANVPR